MIHTATFLPADAQQPSLDIGGTSLTNEQKELISNTLSRFDVNRLSEADAKSIVSTFTDAGIQPGRELTETMATAGFDARLVGEMAGVQGPPQGAIQEFNLSDQAMQEFYRLLDQFYVDETSDDTRNDLIHSVRKLLGSKESLINISA